MIRACDAHKNAVIEGKGKKYIEKIEKYINAEIKDGKMSTSVPIDLEESSNYGHSDDTKIATAIMEELKEYGYDVKIQYAQPLPFGCPSDQWNFNNGHIDISW